VDVQRYLEGEPSWPVRRATLRVPFARRNRAAFAATTGILVTLLVGAAHQHHPGVARDRAEYRALSATKPRIAVRRRRPEQERQRRSRKKPSPGSMKYLCRTSISPTTVAHRRQISVALASNASKHIGPAAGQPDLRGFEWRYLLATQPVAVNMSLNPMQDRKNIQSKSPGARWRLPRRRPSREVEHPERSHQIARPTASRRVGLHGLFFSGWQNPGHGQPFSRCASGTPRD